MKKIDPSDLQALRAAVIGARRQIGLLVLELDVIEARISRMEGAKPEVRIRRDWKTEVASWLNSKPASAGRQ